LDAARQRGPEARTEELKIRRLRTLVDLVTNALRQTDMPLAEAVRLVQGVRVRALELFPGKENTYDLLYAPRFARVLREKYRVQLEN